MSTKRMLASVGTCMILAGIHGATHAVDGSNLSAVKQTKAKLYVDSKEAYDFLQKAGSSAYFVDVRTRAEVSYVGMPTIADANIPYVEQTKDASWDDEKSRFKQEGNNDFEPELARRLAARGLSKAAPIILMCRSGDRSARAANLLKEQGYENVYTVVDGFEGDLAIDGPKAGQRVVNGWKNTGLPWSYALDKDKMYFPKY